MDSGVKPEAWARRRRREGEREKAEERTRSEARLRKQVEAGATRPACACAFLYLPFPRQALSLSRQNPTTLSPSYLLRLSNLIRPDGRIAPNISRDPCSRKGNVILNHRFEDRVKIRSIRKKSCRVVSIREKRRD